MDHHSGNRAGWKRGRQARRIDFRSPRELRTTILSQRAQTRIVRAIVSGWSIIATVSLVISQIPNLDARTAIKIGAVSACGFALSMILHVVMAGRAKRGRDPDLALMLFAAFASGLVLWVAAVGIGAVVDDGWATLTAPLPYLIRDRLGLVPCWIAFVLQGAACMALGSELTMNAQERQLLEARLAALRFQLNPHFVFNTLNAISTLVVEAGSRDAEEMIARLSEFLRSSLSGDPNDLVSLASEIDLVQSYLEIESIRFGDRLAIRYDYDGGLSDAQVPSFILQPLVENAVKYAVAPSKEPVTITLEARSSGKDLRLVVQDDGRARSAIPSQSGTGVGLRNIAARLDALYAAKGRLETEHGQDGFTVTVHLPLDLPPTSGHDAVDDHGG